MGRLPLPRGLVRAVALGVLVSACDAASDTGVPPGSETRPDEAEVAFSDDTAAIYRVPLSVHVSMSALDDPELAAILGEINSVWLSQAGICFETTIRSDDAVAPEGFDLWLSADTLFDSPQTNGLYRGPHDVWSLDRPRLSPAPNPIAYPAARTSAHELGHGLGLSHQNCGSECPCGASLGLDCDDLLMRSGYDGFALSPPEIATARQHAAENALPDTSPGACTAPGG